MMTLNEIQKQSTKYVECCLDTLSTNGRLTTTLYDKRDDFHAAIVNFLFICSNIPLLPAYGVYISQFIRSAREWYAYEDLLWGHGHVLN